MITGGADIAIVDLDEEVGLKTAESLRAMGVDSFFVPCDIADKQQVDTMIATIVERFGYLDIGIKM